MSTVIPFILAGLTVVGLVMLVSLLAKNYIKVPPNQVAVFYGRKSGDRGFSVVTGGARFRIPFFEEVQYMSMAVFQLQLDLRDIPNKDSVPVDIRAVAMCKVKDDKESLMSAVQRFLGRRDDEIHQSVQENLEGQLRAVIGAMTIEELINNRETLVTKVKSEAAEEIGKIGIAIDILNIQSINDKVGYIKALGAKREAEVKRDAEIARAEANRDSTKRSTTADKEGNVTRAENEALTAQADKDRDVKKAQYSAEVQAEQAKAAQAGPLAQAKMEQEVVVEQTKIEQKRAEAQIGVQQQLAKVAEQRQIAEVVVPAQKQAEAAKETAAGQANAVIEHARGEAESIKLSAEARKTQLEAEGAGEAAKIRAIGQANADATKAVLLAEAEGLLKKAEAYKAMDQAAQIQMILEKLPAILEKLPDIVAAAAQPMSAIDKVVIIDQGGGQNGMARFISGLPAPFAALMQIAKESGFDLEAAFKKVGIGANSLTEGDPAPGKPGTEAETDKS